MSTNTTCSSCGMTEYFRDNSRWCSTEPVCQDEINTLSSPSDWIPKSSIALHKNIPFAQCEIIQKSIVTWLQICTARLTDNGTRRTRREHDESEWLSDLMTLLHGHGRPHIDVHTWIVLHLLSKRSPVCKSVIRNVIDHKPLDSQPVIYQSLPPKTTHCVVFASSVW